MVGPLANPAIQQGDSIKVSSANPLVQAGPLVVIVVTMLQAGRLAAAEALAAHQAGLSVLAGGGVFPAALVVVVTLEGPVAVGALAVLTEEAMEEATGKL